MDLELTDSVTLITGGTDGLGLALASRLVQEGGMVAVCGRDEERLARAQDVLGPSALCYQADVTRAADLDGFVDTTLERFGLLNAVVNNAGKSAGTPVAMSSDDEWREDYELKVLSALHLSRRALPFLRESRGAILNILAIMARAPEAGTTPTAASRAAGLAFTKSLAAEVAPDGIRVNAILIGLIESGQWVRCARNAGSEQSDFYQQLAASKGVPLGRVGRAEEFADLASFLLSARASYITGVGISLDGGLSPVI
jgi:NAD(P)-dependent dehydrogenase (short-subunit alcohol dehydrogenase family)